MENGSSITCPWNVYVLIWEVLFFPAGLRRVLSTFFVTFTVILGIRSCIRRTGKWFQPFHAMCLSPRKGSSFPMDCMVRVVARTYADLV